MNRFGQSVIGKAFRRRRSAFFCFSSPQHLFYPLAAVFLASVIDKTSADNYNNNKAIHARELCGIALTTGMRRAAPRYGKRAREKNNGKILLEMRQSDT